MKNEFKTGNPIWVYYRDMDNNDNLRLPQLLRGHLGQHYEIKQIEIPNYTLMQTTGTLEGQFDETAKSVCFYYRKKSWVEIQKVDLYLYLDETTTVYDQVEGMPMPDTLPAGIYVKAFQRIATNEPALWYQVNADQWLKFDQDTMKLMANDPFAGQDTTKSVADLTYLALNHVTATVDFLPDRTVETYDQPYGQSRSRLMDGSEVVLTGRLTDDNGVTWYQVEGHGYINASYVKLTDVEE